MCGHRGASAQAPENTLAAFRGALEAGCDLVELDVLLSRDHELVVFHDSKLDRTTDRAGRVTSLTFEEIQSCDAGRWFGDGFRGERVPHLREALEVLGGRATPMIELKHRARRAPALVPRLAKVLSEAGYADRAVVIAWDDVTAASVRRLLPEVLVSRIAFTRLAIRRAAALGFDGIVPWRASASARFLAEARESNVFVAPWTVNRPRDMDHFCRAGADIVVTDVPHVLRDVLERVRADRPRTSTA